MLKTNKDPVSTAASESEKKPAAGTPTANQRYTKEAKPIRGGLANSTKQLTYEEINAESSENKKKKQENKRN